MTQAIAGAVGRGPGPSERSPQLLLLEGCTDKAVGSWGGLLSTAIDAGVFLSGLAIEVLEGKVRDLPYLWQLPS